ncbi:MAG: glycosyltransferase family 2 protein [Synergistaceae bacterium]|nr:glycosyltransferase family 2 protein [Synergistaceae bacterium]
MVSPLISIIMPAYNSDKYITESIHSVINQTYINWELIVIDDGSQDKTIDCINYLKNKDARIFLYRNKRNIGVSQTRNKGVKLARGEWIVFLDSDDCWETSKLNKQLNFARQKNADFTFTSSSFMDEEGKNYRWIMEIPEVVSYSDLLKHNVISCSSVLIKKECVKNHTMKGDSMHEDFAMWLDILMDGKIAYGINEPLLIYRISKKSKSGNKIKSIAMSYRTYRSIGLGFTSSIYFMCFHLIGRFIKYSNLYKKGYIAI